MLGQAVQIAYGPVVPDMSGLDARKLLKKLQQLANRDPDHEFDVYYGRLQLKLLKKLRKFKH